MQKPSNSTPMNLATLSTDDLDNVTGGKDSPPGGSSSGGGSGDDAMLTTLQGIQSSLKDLSKNQNNQGLFGGANGMMFMTMALALNNRRSEVVVYGGGCRRGRCGRW